MLIRNADQWKIELNAKDNDTRTPFHLACSEGHLEVAQLLMRIPEIGKSIF